MTSHRSPTFPILLICVLLGAAWAAAGAPSEESSSVVKLTSQSRIATVEGDLEKGRELAEAALAVDPSYPGAWKQAGRVAMLSRDWPGALNSFQCAWSLRPGDPDLLLWMIDMIADADDATAVSVSEFVNRCDAAPAYRAAMEASNLMRSGDLPDAERVLKSVGPMARQGAEIPLASAWLRMGLMHNQGGRYDRAVLADEETLRIRPGWVDALRELGWAFRALGQPAKAAETWERGLAAIPHREQWLLWITEAYVAAGSLPRAEATIDDLLVTSPDHPGACAFKVMFLTLRESADLPPFEATLGARAGGGRVIALGHALAERHLGRFPAAAARLEALRATDFADMDVGAMLAEIYQAWASSVDLPDRVTPLQRLVGLRPEQRGAWRDLGWSLWTSGRHDEAIAAWEKFIDPSDAEQERVQLQLVATIAESDAPQRAVSLYRKWRPGAPLLPVGVALVSEGRPAAVAPFIEAAAREGENPPVASLYLARIASGNGLCAKSAGMLAEFLQNHFRKASESEIQVFLSSLETCSDDPDMLPLIRRASELYPPSTPPGRKVTEILEATAFRQASLHGPASAVEFHLAALHRDPDRPGLWRRAYQVLRSLGRNGEATALLGMTESQSRTMEVREGIAAMEAMERGDPESALDHLDRSLLADPRQADLHLDRFRVLMSLGRFVQARLEEDWFSSRADGEDHSFLAMLAEIETALGKDAEALELWRRLELASPRTTYFALESARALFRLCRPEDAVRTIEDFVAVEPDIKAYRLLAEMEAQLGRPERVLFWTQKGLDLQRDRHLLELRAEAGDILGDADVVKEGVEQLGGPGRLDGTLARVLGDAIQSRGETETARAFQKRLLRGNQDYLPALTRLEELAALTGDTAGALRYADLVLKGRPGDLHAQRIRAVKAAENGDTKQGIGVLRRLTRWNPARAVPILVYSNVTRCPYSNRNTITQVTAHLERLAAAGYQCVFPSEIAIETESSRVVIVVVDTGPAAIRKIDSVLRRIGGRAVFAVGADALVHGIIDETGNDFMEGLRNNPRWLVASRGKPLEDADVNPFTHRMSIDGKTEDAADFAHRVDGLLGDASSTLPPARAVFLYPYGDYGQLSLDTDHETLETLRERVRMRFDLAVALDDRGFAGPESDPLRLPGKQVPPTWTSDGLMEYLAQRNPLVEARLDLARALSRNARHEQADEWFRLAEAAGADPAELQLAWGSNAFFQGDLPTALERIRKARELAPGSEKVAELLRKVELRQRPRIESHVELSRDSDQRETLGFGATAEASFTDRLGAAVFYDHRRWSREGYGSTEGDRTGAGLLWAFGERRSAQARVWNMDIEGGKDFVGFDGRLHLPNPLFNGDLEFQATRKQVDTVEATRAGILEHDLTFGGTTRFLDTWDLAVVLDAINRTDHNNTFSLQGSLVRRLREAPFIGLGYAFRFADSDAKSDLYWAPMDLWQHQACLLSHWRIEDWLSYDVGVKAGVSRELDHGSSFVWNAKGNLTLTPVERMEVNIEASHMESSSYRESSVLLSIGARF